MVSLGDDQDWFPEDATASRVAAGIDHPRKRATVAALARTGNVSAACRASGIARRTHYDWIAGDPDYSDAVEQAMEEAGDVLEAVARKRAIVGSDILLIFLLKAIRPAKFRDRPAQDIRVIEQPPRRTVESTLARLPINAQRRFLAAYPEAERSLPPDSPLLARLRESTP